MTFEADILDDCELFDAVQTVTLTLLDGTTESVAYVTTSKLTKEQTRQYGPIGADDEIRNYSLPVNELASNVPEQDCTITDASGLVWKIKSVEKRTVGTRYLCMCVKTRAEYETVLIPTALTATTSSNTQINLAWTDNSSNETAFDVQRSTDNATWTTINSPAANSTSYSATGLIADTLYYFRIRARNSWTQSSWTSSVSARTRPTPTAIWTSGNSGDDTGEIDLTTSGGPGAESYGVFPASNSYMSFNQYDAGGTNREAILAAITVGTTIRVVSANGDVTMTVTESTLQELGSYLVVCNYVSGTYPTKTLGIPVYVVIT